MRTVKPCWGHNNVYIFDLLRHTLTSKEFRGRVNTVFRGSLNSFLGHDTIGDASTPTRSVAYSFCASGHEASVEFVHRF